MTQKSESVREAEQRPTNDQLMNMAEHLTQSSSKVLYSYLVDVRYVSSEWAAKSVTLKLAEEAEQEPVNIWKSLPRCCGYPKCDGDLVGLKHSSECALYNKPEPTPAQRVAAWLREKAR